MSEFDKRATAAYLEAHNAFSAILLRHDPMLIGEGVPDDEYDHEATKLLAKFKHAASLDDAEAIVGDLFSDPESQEFLPNSWRPLATDLWKSWSTFQQALKEAHP